MSLPLPQINLTKTKKDILSFLSANIFYKLTGYLVIVLLARYLGKEIIGKYFFAISFVGIFLILSELGINPLLIRNVSRDKSITQKYMSNIMGLRLILSLFCFGIVFIIAHFVQREILLIIFLTSIFMLMESLYYSLGSLFLAHHKVKYNIISGVTTKLLLISLILFALHYNLNLVSILWIHIVCSGFMLFLALFIVRTKIAKISINFNWGLYKQIIKESVPFALLTLIGIIFYRADTVMLGFMKTYNEVGIYGAGFKLREAILFIPSSVAIVLYPQMAELYRRTTKLKRLYLKAIKWLFLPSLLSIIIVIPFARPIITAIYGSEFINSVRVLKILYLTAPFIFFNIMAISLFKAINKEKILIFVTIGCLLFKIILNLYLIPIYGYLGVAITTIIIDVAQCGILCYYIHRYFKTKEIFPNWR